MNCEQFDQLIVRLACEQLSEPAAALAHAQSCATCGARLARQRNVAAGLQLLAADEQKIQAPAQLAVSLQAAFAQQMSSQTAPKPGLFAWLHWRFAAPVATLVLCAALAAVWWRSPADTGEIVNVPPKEKEVAFQPPTVDLTKPDALVPAASFKPQPRPKRKVTPRRTEEYGALLSLTPLANSEPDEFQQVVRMQIPRATLRLWGVPLNEESNSEQIHAEVVFGEDGVARAIRLRQ